MAYTTIRGKILYTSKKPERMDEERGREYFTLTIQDDGVRVLHAHCEIDDAPMVVRDVVLSYDEQNLPIDCTYRLTVGHKFEGTGWFRFGTNFIESETFNQKDGRISQKVDMDAPIQWFGSHPIVGDGLGLKVFDLSQGPGKQLFPNMAVPSPDHRGATGPTLFRLGYGLEYKGEETITVPAGTFDCYVFAFTDTAGQLPEEHPPYTVWCTKDHYVAVAAEAGGYMKTRYELTEYVVE